MVDVSEPRIISIKRDPGLHSRILRDQSQGKLQIGHSRSLAELLDRTMQALATRDSIKISSVSDHVSSDTGTKAKGTYDIAIQVPKFGKEGDLVHQKGINGVDSYRRRDEITFAGSELNLTYKKNGQLKYGETVLENTPALRIVKSVLDKAVTEFRDEKRRRITGSAPLTNTTYPVISTGARLAAKPEPRFELSERKAA